MNNEMVFDAIEYAAAAHRGQLRKVSGVPYIIHPIRVGNILLEAGCGETVVSAGVLHDTVEDTEVTEESLRRDFGPRVAELVMGVSEKDKSDTWENRKQAMLESLGGADEETLIIACADKLDNIRGIRHDIERLGEAIWDRFRKPREAQEWYFRSASRVFVSGMKSEIGSRMNDELMLETDRVFYNRYNQ